MNQKPIHLSISDITQTRFNGGHAHFPVDPDTTARLDRVIQSPTRFKLRFKDRYPLLSLVLHGIAFFLLFGLLLISVLIIREAYLN